MAKTNKQWFEGRREVHGRHISRSFSNNLLCSILNMAGAVKRHQRISCSMNRGRVFRSMNHVQLADVRLVGINKHMKPVW